MCAAHAWVVDLNHAVVRVLAAGAGASREAEPAATTEHEVGVDAAPHLHLVRRQGHSLERAGHEARLAVGVAGHDVITAIRQTADRSVP